MELETVNKLFLELSQITTAKTKRELELEDLLTSARAICQRRGEETAWERFDERVAKAGIGSVTPRVFRVLDSDAQDEASRADKVLSALRAARKAIEDMHGEEATGDQVHCYTGDDFLKIIIQIDEAIGPQ